ncbi:hypothetical protein JYB88_01750 [Shewanella cyperi]|uniref:Uncharacterized protein n=1 Tax=Shewanella cyperi TaxID=2814292 RepID=A0A975ALH3_9GAMM|nr:hypothetical protein [Shewanella cyperi]QSX30407.1 hypothetical protein JYB88_01750 [Shewanella cyperi]
MNIDLIINLFKDGYFWLAILAFVIPVISSLKHIVEFYDSSKKLRSASITAALADPNVTDELKEHLRDEANLEHFRIIYGVRLSTPMLNATMVLKARVGAQVQFRHVLNVIKTSPDIDDMTSLSYRVKLGRFDRWSGWYNLILGFSMAMFGIPLTMLALYSVTASFHAGLLLIGLFCLGMGFYMAKDGILVLSVRHVNKALADYERAHANTNNHSSAATDNSSPDSDTAPGMA